MGGGAEISPEEGARLQKTLDAVRKSWDFISVATGSQGEAPAGFLQKWPREGWGQGVARLTESRAGTKKNQRELKAGFVSYRCCDSRSLVAESDTDPLLCGTGGQIPTTKVQAGLRSLWRLSQGTPFLASSRF